MRSASSAGSWSPSSSMSRTEIRSAATKSLSTADVDKRLLPRIRVLNLLDRFEILFDDEVAGVRFDHTLDVLDLVAGKDAELPWVLAQSFVLVRSQVYDGHAGGVRAFTHEADFGAL